MLRAVAEVLMTDGQAGEKSILHLPKCCRSLEMLHEASTAANPHSQKCAYGRDFGLCGDHAALRGDSLRLPVRPGMWDFYHLVYRSVLQNCPDGGSRRRESIVRKTGKIIGGRMTAEGKVF